MGIKAIPIRERLGGLVPASTNVTCRFWKEGRCNRNPCGFLHGEPQHAYVHQHGSSAELSRKHPDSNVCQRGSNPELSRKCLDSNVCQRGNNAELLWKRRDFKRSGKLSVRSEKNLGEDRTASGPKVIYLKRIRSYLQSFENSKKVSAVPVVDDAVSEDKTSHRSVGKVSECWMSGNCLEGDKCELMHSSFLGNGLSMMARLEGHNQVVSGIALPAGSDKLYSGSYDGTVRVWDCHTGQLSKVVNLGENVGCLISEGPWVFVGIPNVLKAWNTETVADFSLDGPVGQIYAIIVALDMLFAGVQDGAIVVWKASTERLNPFQLEAFMKGHSAAVTCLAVGDMRLYSGSMDCTIRVWSLDNLQCICTLNEHVEAVTSLIFCNQYLLSSSLDRKIKVWVAREGGNLEVTYTHVGEHGALTLSGLNDEKAKPILLCSSNDNSVRLYELPSFTDRGRIVSRKEVRAIQTAPGGLFLTGDGTGALTVWKMV